MVGRATINKAGLFRLREAGNYAEEKVDNKDD